MQTTNTVSSALDICWTFNSARDTAGSCKQ